MSTDEPPRLASLEDEIPYGLRHREVAPTDQDPARVTLDPLPPGPRVPSWVVDVAKWGSLSRHERRQMGRFHRKQIRRG
jgi:hypothetical protein